MSIFDSILHPVCSPICGPIGDGDVYGTDTPWLPSVLSGLSQRFLDQVATYYASTLASLPVITPEETGTLAIPRGGRCNLYDGVNDYSTLGARLTSGSLTDFTFATWVKTSSTSKTIAGEYNATGNQRGWKIGTSSTGKLQVVVSADGGSTNIKDYSGATAINDGAWHHVSFTFSSGSMILYVDGVAETLTKTTDLTVNSIFSSTAAFIVAADGAGSNAIFGGSLRDIRPYSVTKTAPQIAAIYNQASTPTTIDRTGLLAGYWCEDEAGTTVRDWSGNGKHLTATNVTTATFHATDSGVTYSAANELGHSAGVIVTVPTGWVNGWVSSATLTGDGYVEFIQPANTSQCIYGLTTASSLPSSTSYASINFGVLASDGRWESGVNTGGSYSIVAGDRIRFTRSGSTVTLQKNGTTVGTFSATSSATLRACVAANATGFDTTCLTVNGQYPGTNSNPGGSASDLIVPRNEASTSADVLGNTLGNPGPLKLPATTEVPCVTGDGSAVYCDLGSALIPESADFSISLRYYNASTSIASILGQFTAATAGRLGLVANSSNTSGTATPGSLEFWCISASANITLSGALTMSAWHDIQLSRSGNTFTLTCTPVGGSTVTGTVTAAATILQVNTKLLALASGTIVSSGRISALSVATGGVTKTFPLQEGPGTGNTNRTIYWVGSDGTSGSVANAITSGTVSSIWANRCPYVQDHFLNYGGRVASGVAIPGRIGSGLGTAADGNAVTHSAGKHGNPYSRIVPNYWGAPSLTAIGHTASTKLAPTDAVQSTSPADTKFRRTSSSGDDRYLAFRSALTGSDKSNMENYCA